MSWYERELMAQESFPNVPTSNSVNNKQKKKRKKLLLFLGAFYDHHQGFTDTQKEQRLTLSPPCVLVGFSHPSPPRCLSPPRPCCMVWEGEFRYDSSGRTNLGWVTLGRMFGQQMPEQRLPDTQWDTEILVTDFHLFTQSGAEVEILPCVPLWVFVCVTLGTWYVLPTNFQLHKYV